MSQMWQGASWGPWPPIFGSGSFPTPPFFQTGIHPSPSSVSTDTHTSPTTHFDPSSNSASHTTKGISSQTGSQSTTINTATEGQAPTATTTVTPTATSISTSTSHVSRNMPLLAGVIVAALLASVAIIVALFFYYRRSRKLHRSNFAPDPFTTSEHIYGQGSGLLAKRQVPARDIPSENKRQHPNAQQPGPPMRESHDTQEGSVGRINDAQDFREMQREIEALRQENEVIRSAYYISPPSYTASLSRDTDSGP